MDPSMANPSNGVKMVWKQQPNSGVWRHWMKTFSFLLWSWGVVMFEQKKHQTCFVWSAHPSLSSLQRSLWSVCWREEWRNSSPSEHQTELHHHHQWSNVSRAWQTYIGSAKTPLHTRNLTAELAFSITLASELLSWKQITVVNQEGTWLQHRSFVRGWTVETWNRSVSPDATSQSFNLLLLLAEIMFWWLKLLFRQLFLNSLNSPLNLSVTINFLFYSWVIKRRLLRRCAINDKNHVNPKER